jgi:hypothetical protein
VDCIDFEQHDNIFGQFGGTWVQNLFPPRLIGCLVPPPRGGALVAALDAVGFELFFFRATSLSLLSSESEPAAFRLNFLFCCFIGGGEDDSGLTAFFDSGGGEADVDRDRFLVAVFAGAGGGVSALGNDAIFEKLAAALAGTVTTSSSVSDSVSVSEPPSATGGLLEIEPRACSAAAGAGEGADSGGSFSTFMSSW